MASTARTAYTISASEVPMATMFIDAQFVLAASAPPLSVKPLTKPHPTSGSL